MHKGTNKDLALHRLSMSEDCIKTAKRDLENDDFYIINLKSPII